MLLTSSPVINGYAEKQHFDYCVIGSVYVACFIGSCVRACLFNEGIDIDI